MTARPTKVEKMADHAVREAAKIVYQGAVQRIATALRPRFESGELRGWIEGDERIARRGNPPTWKIERECTRRFIRSIREAGIVLLAAPDDTLAPAANDFDRPEHVATTAMAQDVLRYARAQGWTKPRPGEAGAHP
jgi:hypothetical protein